MGKSIMWKYIEEEKDRLKDVLSSQQLANFLKEYEWTRLKRILFVASGSSLNITLVAKRFFEELAQVEVTGFTPSDFTASPIFSELDKETTLVVAISQTGTSRGTIDA